MSRRSLILALPLVAVLGPALVGRAADAPSRIIVDYSKLKPSFPGTNGIFRNPEDPPQEQWIKESTVARTLAGTSGKLGFLAIKYIVEGIGKYNGYWWKFSDRKLDDWSAFKDGYLVLRIAPGDKKCTPRFKIEVKKAHGDNGALDVFKQYAWCGDKHHFDAIAKQGFVDIALPLSDFQGEADVVDGKVVEPSLNDDLSGIGEIVLVFENSEIPEGDRTGQLLINQIRLERKQ